MLQAAIAKDAERFKKIQILFARHGEDIFYAFGFEGGDHEIGCFHELNLSLVIVCPDVCPELVSSPRLCLGGDNELPHHPGIFMFENVAMIHIRQIGIGIIFEPQE